jgi:hypothetical protein
MTQYLLEAVQLDSDLTLTYFPVQEIVLKPSRNA